MNKSDRGHGTSGWHASLFPQKCTPLSQALRLYDHNKGGAQKFPALIGGRPPVELTLDVKEKTMRNVDGRGIALTKYLYGIPGFDLYAWADPQFDEGA
jgi:hypothetical protein